MYVSVYLRQRVCGWSPPLSLHSTGFLIDISFKKRKLILPSAIAITCGTVGLYVCNAFYRLCVLQSNKERNSTFSTIWNTDSTLFWSGCHVMSHWKKAKKITFTAHINGKIQIWLLRLQRNERRRVKTLLSSVLTSLFPLAQAGFSIQAKVKGNLGQGSMLAPV